MTNTKTLVFMRLLPFVCIIPQGHTFATNYLLYSDGDIYKLSMLLGHSDVTTSEIYLHYANYYSFMKTKKSFSFLDSFNDETP